MFDFLEDLFQLEPDTPHIGKQTDEAKRQYGYERYRLAGLRDRKLGMAGRHVLDILSQIYGSGRHPPTAAIAPLVFPKTLPPMPVLPAEFQIPSLKTGNSGGQQGSLPLGSKIAELM